MSLPSSRIIYLLVAIGCFSAIGAALYMEHVMGLEPCPLCIFQRVMVIIAGCIALVAAIHTPAAFGIRVYASSMMASAVVGGGIAIRQLWLQSLPADQVPACAPSLDYLLDVFPLTDVLSMVLTGDGSCAEVQWLFLGLSLPGWTLIGFVGLVAIGTYQLVRPRKG